MSSLPSETITLLLTDVQSSTRLWEQEPEEARAALTRHDALAAEVIASHGGRLIKARGEGDSLFAVFDRASRAITAAGALQHAYCREPWPTNHPFRVRMAIHTGEVIARDGDYYGPTVNRCARIRAAAHGGQILLSQSAYELARDSLPDVAAMRDLGRHRLRDLQRPEQIYQLTWAGCPTEFPPLVSLDLFKHNLPRQLTSFIGREREIAAARALLSGAHLLTITGMGGSGKTRMAQQLAAEVLEDYPDGVWLVELASLADLAQATKAVAEALLIREEPGVPLLDTLCKTLATRYLLLLLDNCEHLEDICAALANLLLQECPYLRILATSRSRLGVAGEVAWPLPTLPLPDRADLPSLPDSLNYAALRLFVERAASVHPEFALTSANLPAVTDICRRLDGIPLAIELAAARVTVLTAQEIATRLDDSFRLLKTSNKQAPERHKTLEALIDWSYNLLAEPERILLRRLSVFVGGWTLSAAETICSDAPLDEPDILDLLSQLVRDSLVVVDEHDGARRYRLLETVRQYSQEKLEQASESASLRDIHLRYFLNLAEEAAPYLTTSEQNVWLPRLETDHDNLRAALKWANNPARLQLAGALCRFWIMRGHIAEARSRLEGALQRGRATNEAVQARALYGIGMLMVRQGEHRAALNTFEESLALYRAIGDDQGSAETINYMGIALRYVGELLQARERYETSLQLYQKLGYRWGIAAACNNLGIVARDLGDATAAFDYYMQSWSIYRELGDTAKIASVANNLGDLSVARKDFAAAHQFFADAVEQFRRMEDRSNLAHALHNLAVSDHKLHLYQEALPLHLESLAIVVELKDQDLLPIALMGLSDLALVADKQTLAAELLGLAQAACDHSGVRLPPDQQQDFDRNVAIARESLGEQAYEIAWNRGYDAPLSPDRITAQFTIDAE